MATLSNQRFVCLCCTSSMINWIAAIQEASYLFRVFRFYAIVMDHIQVVLRISQRSSV